MTVTTENVVCVYEKNELIAIVKRDEVSGHKLVHVLKEASVDQIANLISPVTEAS